MHILALDTTTRDGSAALIIDGRVIEERRGDATRTHAERLPAELLQVLESHGLTLEAVDLLAVASGPGSFTGLRIGIATMQGLALTLDRPIVPVSALEALATSAAPMAAAGSVVATWMDAHRQDVFSALYRVGPEGLLTELEGPMVGRPAATLVRWRDELSIMPSLFVGDGAARFRESIDTYGSGAAVLPVPLLAGVIGQIASRRAHEGQAIHPAAVQPLYVRRPDAEVARERALLTEDPPARIERP